MKRVFQRIRGKKKEEEEEERSPPKLERPQGDHQLVPAAHRTPQPAPQSIPQNQNSGSLASRPRSRDASKLTTPYVPNDLRVASTCPPGEIGRLLTQPASSLTEDIRNLIRIDFPALCPVCYNFDPYKVPQTPWAKAEYNIPDDWPVGKSTVEESEQLIEAAQGGCLYCGMIVSALRAIHPGWEADSTFIHIFLAAGLPVVVRLQFGVMITIPSRRAEDLFASGPGVFAGQNIGFTATTEHPSKPPIDIETYRPVIPDNRLTVGDIALESLVQDMGFAEEIPGHAGDQKCFNFIKESLETCIRQHECGKDGASPLLPSRIIWIKVMQNAEIQPPREKPLRF